MPIQVDSAAPLFIILNVGSGSKDAVVTHRIIEEVLTQVGREHLVRVVEDPAQLNDIARHTVEQARSRGGMIVVAGGDGTINAVAQATLGSGCPLGVLPQGTFNYFSRTHGIPSDTAEAVRLLLSARAHPVQVGLVNDRVFLVNASMGLYPQLLENREAYKQQFGRSRLVAFWSALITLLREHRQLRLLIEHRGKTRELRTPTLFVSNNRLQLEQVGIPQAQLLEQGLLAAITLRPVGTLTMLGLLVRGAFGQLGEADNVTSFAFKRITVTPAMPYGTRRVKIATDGEIVWLQTPIEFRVAPEPLHLLKPEPDLPAGEPS
ncbi:MAG: diacylglycerol/lipid kinase family protein [Acidiferrobacterales bacterium]